LVQSFTDHMPQARTHTHPFSSPFSRTTRVSRYQKGKTNLDFTEARDSEWQRPHLGRMQVCTSLQTDNHASTPPFSFLQAGCPSCRPTNSVKALKASSNCTVIDFDMLANETRPTHFVVVVEIVKSNLTWHWQLQRVAQQHGVGLRDTRLCVTDTQTYRQKRLRIK